MNIKILTILVILLMFLIGLFFMKNYLFSMDNQNVWLEWQSKPDAPNLWERWDKGSKIYLNPSKYSEEDLIKYYYEDKFNPEKKILNYKYKTHKGSIILDYRQIKIQDEEEWKQNRIKWHGNKNNPWTYGVSMNRGLIIQISVPKKFKDKFLEDGWKIVKMNISNFGSKKDEYPMQKTDVGLPEPILFLKLAVESMENYQSQHGKYPNEWHLLDFTFVNGTYKETDPDIRATEENGNRWCPQLCKYTYVIKSADKYHFLIQALNNDNKVEYEIEQGMNTPRKVFITHEDELCTIEQPRGKLLPEPVMFLNIAAAKFAEYHKQHLEYPQAWDLVDFHYALTPHKATDKNVRPPKGVGTSWRPLGANFTYTIISAGKDYYEIHSTNDQTLMDYEISSSKVSPSPINQ